MTAGLPDRAADRERECTTLGCPHPAAVIGTYREYGAIFPDTAYCQQCADLVGDDVFTPDTAALAARPAPDDGEAPVMDANAHTAKAVDNGSITAQTPSSPGSGEALHDKLAEALPEAFGWARWDVAVIRRAATALLPVVREAIADAVATELEGWATSFRAVGAAAIRRENKRVYPQVADVLEAGARDVRADALRDETRA